MATRTFNNARIVHKHDTEENWLKASNFTPKQGEFIVYDVDSTHTYQRFKIGDGVTNVNDLPFVTDLSNYYTKPDIDSMEFISIADIDEICGTTITMASNNEEVTF